MRLTLTTLALLILTATAGAQCPGGRCFQPFGGRFAPQPSYALPMPTYGQLPPAVLFAPPALQQPAVATSPAGYVWHLDAAGPGYHCLYFGGQQVGGWNPESKDYKPLDGGRWGTPCAPPVPLPGAQSVPPSIVNRVT